MFLSKYYATKISFVGLIILINSTTEDKFYGVNSKLNAMWYLLKNQFSSEGEGRGGLIGSFFSQSGWSIALRGKGEWTNDEVTSKFSESYFTLAKHKRHRKGVSVQKSEDYKTLILNAVGWSNSCHQAWLHFCKLVRCMWLICLTVRIVTSEDIMNCINPQAPKKLF